MPRFAFDPQRASERERERERDALFKNVYRDVSRRIDFSILFRFAIFNRAPYLFIDREVVECSVRVRVRVTRRTRSGWWRKKKKEGKKEEEEEEEEKEKREEKKAVRPRADRFIDLSSGLLSPSFLTFLSTLGFSFSLLTLFC